MLHIGMNITAKVDIEQGDISNRNNLAKCPRCGQKLFEVVRITDSGVFRFKCRRCKNYVIVSAIRGTT